MSQSKRFVAIGTVLLLALSVSAQLQKPLPRTGGIPAVGSQRAPSYASMYHPQQKHAPALRRQTFDPYMNPNANPYANRNRPKPHVDQHYNTYARPALQRHAKEQQRLNAAMAKSTGMPTGGPNIGGRNINNTYHGHFYNAP
jgi:hypothetical protein